MNLSQNQLAELIWTDRSCLSRFEIGRRVPDVFTLCRLADVFGISLDVLVGRGHEMEIEIKQAGEN